MAEVAALTVIGIFVGLALLMRHQNRSRDIVIRDSESEPQQRDQ